MVPFSKLTPISRIRVNLSCISLCGSYFRDLRVKGVEVHSEVDSESCEYCLKFVRRKVHDMKSSSCETGLRPIIINQLLSRFQTQCRTMGFCLPLPGQVYLE